MKHWFSEKVETSKIIKEEKNTSKLPIVEDEKPCPKITLRIILFPSKISNNLRTGVAEEHLCETEGPRQVSLLF